MTLDEQITILEHNAEYERTHGNLQGCLDFRQLVEWLKDYQILLLTQKFGKWIPMTVSSGRDSWKCSVCGRRARGKIENLPYCHCGVKMEGSEADGID